MIYQQKGFESKGGRFQNQVEKCLHALLMMILPLYLRNLGYFPAIATGAKRVTKTTSRNIPTIKSDK